MIRDYLHDYQHFGINSAPTSLKCKLLNCLNSKRGNQVKNKKIVPRETESHAFLFAYSERFAVNLPITKIVRLNSRGISNK